MAKQTVVRPGQDAPVSGQYVQRGPRGGISNTEVTLVKDKTVPPTSKPNCTYVLVDPTIHKD